MGKTLIIAEKPSVATDISKALGGFKKVDDFYESDDYLLSSAVGHLVEIGEPEDEEVKRGKWTFAKLPVIPSHFELKPIEKTQDRLKLLTKLIKRKDVDALINACDAGREGELIFRLIAQHAKTTKPVRRLWLQSMTPKAIRDGFGALRADEDLLPLADAARCRSEADWLIGINGTRVMTAFNSKSGGFQLTTVGRVQTPTLAMIVEREERIKAFKSRTYWEVHGIFEVKAGDYAGRWLDESFKKTDDEHARAERIWDRAKAEAIVAKCTGKTAVVEEESKPTTQASPLLYDLTSLQREANGRFGFSARTTLALAQSLYEKHKALTYPRTDSRALPEDYVATVLSTLDSFVESHAYGHHAHKIVSSKWVKPGNRRIFDNAKVSDHFAIIPTPQPPKALNELEAKLYDLVMKRFLAVFFPSAEFMQTTRITRVAGEAFKTEGKVLINPGWLAVYGKEADTEETGNLTPVAKGESALAVELEAKEFATRPPVRYNEATLLSAMEAAGKNIEDEELRAAMQEKGLGTPATRSSIIEGLINEKYIFRESRELIPTPKASSLITLLRGLGTPELFSAELTGQWETQLAQMERGKLKRDTFMKGIVEMAKHVVAQAKGHESDTVPGDYGVLQAPCPKCGGTLSENYKKYACGKCDFSFFKILASRQLSLEEADRLLTDKRVGPLEGFRSKIGRAFAADLIFTDAFEIEFNWGNKEGGEGEDAEPPDFSEQTPLGACPKCQSRVFEMESAFLCERGAVKPRQCDFRASKLILQQPIERAQMEKLLGDAGKTDLLPKFISNKTKRPFAAMLIRKPDGSIGFEFAPREPKAPKTATKSATKRAVVRKTATAVA